MLMLCSPQRSYCTGLRRFCSSCVMINTRSHLWDEFIVLPAIPFMTNQAESKPAAFLFLTCEKTHLLRNNTRGFSGRFYWLICSVTAFFESRDRSSAAANGVLHTDARRRAGRKARCRNTCERRRESTQLREQRLCLVFCCPWLLLTAGQHISLR